MSAWPIDTSSRCGSVRNSGRFSRFEIVAGVDAEAELVREAGGLDVPLETLATLAFAGLERARERLGVELDPLRAHRRGPTDCGRIRIDEQADPDAGLLQVLDDAFISSTGVSGGQPAWLVISPARTGTSVHLIRPDLANEVQKIRPRIALDVVLDAPRARSEVRSELADIVERDVPRVRARVDGDAGSAGRDAHARRLDHARHCPAARVADVATLLTLTLSVSHRCSLTVPAISEAQPWISC